MKKLPKIALGTWSWGTGMYGGDTVFGNHLTEAQMKEVFDAAMENGLNLWDTAYAYGLGDSEKELGKFIRQQPKGNVIVSTKFTPNLADENQADPCMSMLEGSLERLGVEEIDIYWIHNSLDVERWSPYLIPALKSGKVKAVGVSNHSLEQVKRVNEILGSEGFKIDAVQNHFSLLYSNSIDNGLLDFCKKNGIIFFAYMVLEQGVLSGKYNVKNPLPEGSMRATAYNKVLPQLAKLIDVMKEMGKSLGISPAQVALAWAIHKGTLPIVGATKVHHVTDAARAAQIVLTDEQLITLEQFAKDTGVDTRGGWEGEA